MEHPGHPDVVDVAPVPERQLARLVLGPAGPDAARQRRLQLLAGGDRLDGVEHLDVAGAAAEVGAEVAGHVVPREVRALLVDLAPWPARRCRGCRSRTAARRRRRTRRRTAAAPRRRSPSSVIDRAPLHLGQRRLARDHGLALDQHRAAAALTRRRAAVLGRGDVQLLPQRGQQVRVVRTHRHGRAVDGEADRARSRRAVMAMHRVDPPLRGDAAVQLRPAVAVEVEQRVRVAAAPVEVAAGRHQLVAGGQRLGDDLAAGGDDARSGRASPRPPRRRPWPRRPPTSRSGRRRPASPARCGSPAGCPGSGRARSGWACCTRRGSARRPGAPSPGRSRASAGRCRSSSRRRPPKAGHTPKLVRPGLEVVALGVLERPIGLVVLVAGDVDLAVAGRRPGRPARRGSACCTDGRRG